MKNRKLNFGCFLLLFFALFCNFSSLGQTSFNPDSLLSLINSDINKEGKLEAFTLMAQGYIDERLFDSAIYYCDAAIKVAIDVEDEGTQAQMNVLKGKAVYFAGKGPLAAIEPYKVGYLLSSGINDSALMASALNGMGVMYEKLGFNDSSLTCYIQLATIAEKKNYMETLGKGYVNMGILYVYEKDFEKANYYLDLSMEINKKHDSSLVALALMNKGLVLYDMEEYDSSLLKYQQALTIFSETGSLKNLADLYNNFGNTYTELEDLDSADYYYIKSKEIYVELGDWYTFCQVYHNLALNAYYRGNYQKALKMFDSCLVVAKREGNIKLESKSFKAKHDVYATLGNYKMALENYWLFDSLDQQIYNMDKDALKANLEMKYQNEKKQARILTLERDNLKKSRQNYIYLFTGIGIILLIGFVFLYFRQKAVKDRIIARQRIQQLEEEKKLLAAKSLVEGQEEERKRIAREIHDGLGVLLSTTKMQFSTIIETSPEIRPIVEKASKLLEQASNDARKISHNMMPGLLTKLGLYEAVEDLFEKISDTESLKVHVDIPEDLKRLPENNEIMVYRIIQELVNNTIKHAEAKNIRLCMQVREDQLDIGYSDDGKGFDYNEKIDSKSIGLTSIQSRVNFLNGKMQVTSEPGQGASFRVLIPY